MAVWLSFRFPLGPSRRDIWHFDEVVVTIGGKKHWLWRAVERDPADPFAHGVGVDRNVGFQYVPVAR